MQFKIVKDAKPGYVATRNTIERAFKFKRDEYNAKAADNLSLQREVIAVISEEEERLKKMIDAVNLRKLIEENKSKLQERVNQLKCYDVSMTEAELLEMKDNVFLSKLSEAKEIFLIKKEEELRIEQERIKREKEIEEAKKQAKEEAEKQAKEREEMLKKESAEREEKVKEEANKKIQKEREEKERIIQEQKQKEIVRLEEEKKQKEEAKKQAKDKKYKKWLLENKYNEDTHFIQNNEKEVIMYKKISTFIK
jgi:hypothetical protein